ncbi:hypothetical protein V8E55_008070 [Tylopilus felleus]
MDSTGPTTAIIRCNLGTAAAFDQTVFPVGYYEAGSNFGKACFLLEATVDEMATIAQLGIDLNKNDGFIFGTRVKVDDLRERKAKIEGNRKTINPIKVFRNITGKDAREFHTVSRSVFLETKRTSEKIQREDGHLHVVPSTQVRIIDGATPQPNAVIDGIIVNFPNGLDDNARRTLYGAMTTITNTDPFDDNPLVSQLRDGEQVVTLDDSASSVSQDVDGSAIVDGNRTSVASSNPQSRPTSPQIINIVNVIRESILTSRFTVTGLAVNRGSHNTGGTTSVTQEFVQ